MALNLDRIDGPIDPSEPRFTALLANLQGNILKSHGRNFTVNLFLTFKDGFQNEVEQWIGTFTRRYVTSALRQQHETIEFKTNGISGRLFATLSLSAAGYTYLGKDLDAFREETNPFTSSVRFTRGMAAAQQALGDPDPADWPVNPGGSAHALVLLADELPPDGDTRLAHALARLQSELDPIADVHAVFGVGLRDEKNQPLEHFGYRDGISQPLFFQDEVEREAAQFGTEQWNPAASPSLVLVPDPFIEKEDCCGSYFVFRVLEQQVKAFKEAEEGLGFGERGGAMVVGRFENGVPLEVTGSEQAVGFRDFNDFNYHDDQEPAPGGNLEYRRCPFQGHIRKTNPRGDTARVLFNGNPGLSAGASTAETDQDERAHRIARRGITFGERDLYRREASVHGPGELVKVGAEDKPGSGFLPGDDELEAAGFDPNHPEGGVGLLFQCYQRSISNQFGFIQIAWANNPNFPATSTGIDPIIGQGNPNADPQRWAPTFDDATEPRVASPFGGFVTLLGGDFFFTPSVPFLLSFGDGIAASQADLDERCIAVKA